TPSGSYWLGVIDIDHFKRVNDSFGHLIGDEVLLLLSRLMRGSLRARDQLYRFGGEEFVALVRCNGPDSASLAFERLRVNTERYLFPQVEHVTVSVGFTEIVAGDTPSGAFERADKAVYYAKAHGRNQVQYHAALVARGELETIGPKTSDVELF
ncbi:MAG: GGDEF domain-containing protein, partial [Rhizobiales bacterium]|nr:GGDEF domain-containing protein [Rhizobacter sp.]